MPAKPQDNSPEPGFEASLQRLESIVADMEKGELPLETMMERFEEGMRLVGSCTAKLTEVEKKIEKLVRKGDQITSEPFEEVN